MDSRFLFGPPSGPSSTNLDSPFSLLLRQFLPTLPAPLLSPLTSLADSLYAARLARAVRREVGELHGGLREEWGWRSRGVKADFMARLIPSDSEEGEEEEEHERMMPPTILSDVDGQRNMCDRVDGKVAEGVRASLEQGEERLRKALEPGVRLEVECEIGAVMLQAQSEAWDQDEDNLEEDIALQVMQWLVVACMEAGVGEEELSLQSELGAEGGPKSENEVDEAVGRGVEGLQV